MMNLSSNYASMYPMNSQFNQNQMSNAGAFGLVPFISNNQPFFGQNSLNGGWLPVYIGPNLNFAQQQQQMPTFQQPSFGQYQPPQYSLPPQTNMPLLPYPPFGSGYGNGFGNGYGNSNMNSQFLSMMMSMLNNMMSMMMNLGNISNNNSIDYGDDAIDNNIDDADQNAVDDSNNDNGNVDDTDTDNNCKPNPEPKPCDPTPEPPACDDGDDEPSACDRLKGSAGIFGDPYMGLFTPGLDNVPDELKQLQFNIKPEDGLVSILKDVDNGGLDVKVRNHEINPEGSLAIAETSIKAGSDTIKFNADGDILVNGVKKGNINDAGLVAPIKLANGTVATSEEIDDAQGNKVERFSFSNGEYKITAAVRKPEGAEAYLDMNFEELTEDAADNATGLKVAVPGWKNPESGNPFKISLAQLLKIEKNSMLLELDQYQ